MKNDSSNDNIIKRSLISSIAFIILVVIVFYFIFRDNNYREVYGIYKDSKRAYLLVAVFCMSSFSICEAINLKISLNLLKEKATFRNCYKYALAGFFVAGITPSSSGGDPMQLYLMTQDKIKVSNGALTLLLKLLCFQLTVVFLAVIGFISSHKLFLQSLGHLRYIIYLGAFLNILVGTLYFLIIFCKPIVVYLVELLSKLFHKLHIKKADQIVETINVQVEEYSKAATYIKKNKRVLIKMFLVTLTQMILYYSIPYFVYLSLGFNTNSIFTFIALQSVLFVSVSSLPFPGAVGVSEATFMRIYRQMFPKQILGSAMVITRFINFYIFIVYSGVALMYYILKHNFNKR